MRPQLEASTNRHGVPGHLPVDSDRSADRHGIACDDLPLVDGDAATEPDAVSSVTSRPSRPLERALGRERRHRRGRRNGRLDQALGCGGGGRRPDQSPPALGIKVRHANHELGDFWSEPVAQLPAGHGRPVNRDGVVGNLDQSYAANVALGTQHQTILNGQHFKPALDLPSQRVLRIGGRLRMCRLSTDC